MEAVFARLLCIPALMIASSSLQAEVNPALDTDSWIIQSWTVDEGLPESSATAMAQTPDQYLWFGTFGGLVRFDGVTFTVFDPDNTPQLPSPGIVNLHVDRQGRLWISTLEGLVVRDGARWLDFSDDPALADEPSHVRTFVDREDGDLLLTTFFGKIVACSGETLVQLPDPPGRPGVAYWGGVDDDSHWWAAQNQFVGIWDGQQWVRRLPRAALDNVEKENVTCAAARDGGLWVLVDADLRKFSHGIEVSRRQLSAAPLGVWSLFEDSQGNLWMPSYSSGLYQLPPDGQLRCHTEIGGIACRSYRFVFEDHERNLWIGTNANGLIRLTARRFRDYGSLGALAAPVTSVAPAPGGGVWVATYGDGLFRLDERGLTAVPLPRYERFRYSIASVLSDRQGRTWVGMYYDLGLYAFDGAGGRFVPEGQLVGGTVIALFEDSVGRIWISGGRKIAAVAGDVVNTYGPDEGLRAGEVVCFAEDRDGAIWLSNLGGVFRLAGDRFAEVCDAEGNAIPNVACLKSDDDGAMWMGSTRNGLLRWRDGALVTIGPESGLAVRRVLGILDDEAGCFWMSSNRGVLRVARSELNAVADERGTELSCLLFDSTDGLPTIECSGLRQPVSARDPKGRLWFATAKGVGMVDPAHFRLGETPPRVHIEKLVYRVAQSDSDHRGDRERSVAAPFPGFSRLPAGSRGVEIHYTAPTYAAPGKAHFQVRLEPVDPTWRDVGNRRVAYYDDLRAGEYRFRVRACSGDGVWSSADADLRFSVLPLFWETNWFRVLVVVGICGAASAWIFHFRGRLERQRATQAAFTRQLIERQEAERNRVVSELHDGLGHALLLIKNRLALLAGRDEHGTNAHGQFDAVSTDVTRAIAEVRSICQALRPGVLSQVGLTHAITWLIEELRSTTTIEFATELDNIDGLLAPEAEISLYRIVQEGLNNVVKHAGASQVTFTVTRRPAVISVLIQDDGCGFDARHKRSEPERSFGLTGMVERASLLNGRVEWESAPGAGTRVTVTVPVRGQSA
jgi:signal transduction histidine kinase/ligand-binding sensor domain-containing protein